MGEIVQKNKYDLDCRYFHGKLTQICRDMNCYRPDELARALVRVAYTADPQVAVTTAEHLEVQKTKCQVEVPC